VYADIYNSDMMIKDNATMCAELCQPKDPDNLKYTIRVILLWLNLTHLTSFSTTSLWPIYRYSGNQIKYVRAHPTSDSAQCLAFL
ncbi:hypothetical protein V8D89_016354, partial [Ganoderma adspersum]